MRKKLGIPYVCKLILSKKFTAFISIVILSCKVGILGVTLLYCLKEHFQRVGDTKCILPLIAYQPNTAVCFFLGLLPGLVVIPLLAGLLAWPSVLIMHTISMTIRNKKYYPPFQAEIQSIQILIAEWLIERDNAVKEKEYIKALLDVGNGDPKKMLPIEIIQMIAKLIESVQKEENARLKRRIRPKSQSHDYNTLLRVNQANRYFYSHSGYLVLTFDSIYRPTEFLGHDSCYYSVFSKDVSIFALLTILQLSLPYWLYHL